MSIRLGKERRPAHKPAAEACTSTARLLRAQGGADARKHALAPRIAKRGEWFERSVVSSDRQVAKDMQVNSERWLAAVFRDPPAFGRVDEKPRVKTE